MKDDRPDWDELQGRPARPGRAAIAVSAANCPGVNVFPSCELSRKESYPREWFSLSVNVCLGEMQRNFFVKASAACCLYYNISNYTCSIYQYFAMQSPLTPRGLPISNSHSSSSVWLGVFFTFLLGNLVVLKVSRCTMCHITNRGIAPFDAVVLTRTSTSLSPVYLERRRGSR